VGTPVDDEVGAGDPPGLVGGKIENSSGNVFWEANATNRQGSSHLLYQFVLIWGIREASVPEERCIDGPW
jgi:hypothetical protein